MKKPLLSVFSIFVLLSLGSCRPKVVEMNPVIPYVKGILADKYSPEMLMLRHNRAQLPSSDITVIGPQSVCDTLAAMFKTYDVRDNVDGSRQSDGLPDFAGETFAFIADSASYGSYLAGNLSDDLRKQVVLKTLCAIDTVVHISPYDLKGLGYKNSSKIVILADPYLAQYGQYDADSLLSAAGVQAPLVAPIDLMFDKVLDSAKGRPVHVALLCSEGFASSDVFSQRLAKLSADRGITGSECYVFPTERRDSLVHRLLSAYASAGRKGPIDAILVDDYNLNVDSLKLEMKDIMSVMNRTSITYGRFVSPDLVFVSSIEEVASRCYSILRSGNLFTHNIAKPQVVFYWPASNPDTAGSDSIILISGPYVQD